LTGLTSSSSAEGDIRGVDAHPAEYPKSTGGYPKEDLDQSVRKTIKTEVQTAVVIMKRTP